MQKLTHFDESGAVQMVDVGEKSASKRIAVASARVLMGPETVAALREQRMPKGDPLEVARIAGIMAAKQTANLIPLCHQVALSKVDVRAEIMDTGVYLTGEAVTVAPTGVEMEALTAVTVAALTIYDMCKALDKAIVITDVRLESKSGGKSGDFQRS